MLDPGADARAAQETSPAPALWYHGKRERKQESEDDMANSGADMRAAQETSPAPVLPANETARRASDGEIPAEKVGDGWRASPNGSEDARDRRARMAEWLENAKDHQRRIRARRGDAQPINAATILNELREERIEQIVSAARRTKGK